MYIVNEKDLKGVTAEEIKARMDIVDYLTDWSSEVFQGAKDKKTISLAGRYIRSRVLEKGENFAKMLDAVVLVDLLDFWRAVDGYNGKRDDVMLYGVFCMVFSEVNDEIKEESKKVEGNFGYAPKLRYDISERRESDVEDTWENKAEEGKKKVKRKGKKKGIVKDKKKVEPKPKQVYKGMDGDEEYQSPEVHESEEEDVEIVEINDKYVTPNNVNKLTIVAVGMISVLVVMLAWLIIF